MTKDLYAMMRRLRYGTFPTSPVCLKISSVAVGTDKYRGSGIPTSLVGGRVASAHILPSQNCYNAKALLLLRIIEAFTI
jgi:hypothetical protein